MNGLTEFAYLREVAKKYGMFYLLADFEQFVKRVTPQERDELTHAYEEIDRRGDLASLSQWTVKTSLPGSTKTVGRAETDFARQVGQLFVLFSFLGESGVAPFDSGRVRLIEEEKRPNWDNLPPELAYLREPAEDYGIFNPEAEMLEFLERATEGDMEILAQTAERIRLNGGSQVIYEWMNQSHLQDSTEAWMVYCLLGLMDHAGLAFD